MIKTKRIYDDPEETDGYRILVDRLWPRGLSKEKAKIDLWLKEIAPSGKLRKWFSHDPKKWAEFKKRYRKELAGKTELIKKIHRLEKREGTVTLLYGAKDKEHNQATILQEVLARNKPNKGTPLKAC